MSDEQVEAVRRFVKAGGGLVATYETSRYDEKGNPRPDFGLADVFGCHFERILPPAKREFVFWSGGGPYYGARRSLLSSAYEREPLVAVRLAGADVAEEWRVESATAKTIPASAFNDFGSGRAAYISGRWDALQCGRPWEVTEAELYDAVCGVAGLPPVEVRCHRPVGVTLFEQPNRRIVHLVSLNGDTKYASDRVKPVEDVDVWLRPPGRSRITRLHRLWAKAEVPFEDYGNWVEASLGTIGEYEVLVAELTPAPGKP